MTIIQEKPSKDGNFRYCEIKNVVSISAIHTKVNDSYTPGILCYQKDKRYTIGYFASTEQRDYAYELLRYNTSPYIVLDLNTYFVKELDIEFDVSVSKGLKYLKNSIVSLMATHKLDLDKITKLDAFKYFTVPMLFKLMEEEPVLFPKNTEFIWSKTLEIPISVINNGITRLQYFKKLTSKINEKIICSTLHGS